MAAASSAFAVTRYRCAARSSQTTRRATATTTPIATRTGGASQPRSSEYLKKKIAARTSATPAMAENSLTPTSCSQSKPAHGAVHAGRAGITGGTAETVAAGGLGGAMTGGNAPGGAAVGRGTAGVGAWTGRSRGGSGATGLAGGAWAGGEGAAGETGWPTAARSARARRRLRSSIVRRCSSSSCSRVPSLRVNPICRSRATIGSTAMARPISVKKEAITYISTAGFGAKSSAYVSADSGIRRVGPALGRLRLWVRTFRSAF